MQRARTKAVMTRKGFQALLTLLKIKQTVKTVLVGKLLILVPVLQFLAPFLITVATVVIAQTNPQFSDCTSRNRAQVVRGTASLW